MYKKLYTPVIYVTTFSITKLGTMDSETQHNATQYRESQVKILSMTTPSMAQLLYLA